jgi:BirA family biotin operon repressor/biotin-[acetyl-CoA-carboxylase] ligase
MRVAERVRTQLAATTRFDDIRHFDEIDSTNRWLRDQADAGAPEGLVAVAEHQSAGRGRLGRTWDAPSGSGLIVSVLLRPGDLPLERYHLLTAATGLAAQGACGEVGGFTPALKWPNDLLVDDAKLAGILAESTGGAVVVGMGLNLHAAPTGAATADAAAGARVERDELLAAVLRRLDAFLGDWDGVAGAYRAACATVGRWVRVELPDQVLEGMAEAVDDAGRLVVRPAGGGAPLAVAAGDVIHLRRAGPDPAR